MFGFNNTERWSVYHNYLPNSSPVYFVVESSKVRADNIMKEMRKLDPSNYDHHHYETLDDEFLNHPEVDVVYRNTKFGEIS